MTTLCVSQLVLCRTRDSGGAPREVALGRFSDAIITIWTNPFGCLREASRGFRKAIDRLAAGPEEIRMLADAKCGHGRRPPAGYDDTGASLISAVRDGHKSQSLHFQDHAELLPERPAG